MKTTKVPKMNKAEQKIYDAIMRSFPATNPLSAYNHAINGGVKFEHYNR